jgi:hypothetical protein
MDELADIAQSYDVLLCCSGLSFYFAFGVSCATIGSLIRTVHGSMTSAFDRNKCVYPPTT